MLKNKTLERIAHCWNEATLCFPLCHCAQDLELRKRGGGKGGREEKGREHVFSGRIGHLINSPPTLSLIESKELPQDIIYNMLLLEEGE